MARTGIMQICPRDKYDVLGNVVKQPFKEKMKKEDDYVSELTDSESSFYYEEG